MRSKSSLIDKPGPGFIFILGSPLLMEGGGSENWSAPAAPDRQMDEMRGEPPAQLRPRSAAQEPQISAPSSVTLALVPFGGPGGKEEETPPPAGVARRLKPLFYALKIKRALSYGKSVSGKATRVQFPECTNAQIRQRRGNQTPI